jgi:OmpA-OmpF porin, OOP family
VDHDRAAARATILARRARFVAGAVAGVIACGPRAAPAPSLPSEGPRLHETKHAVDRRGGRATHREDDRDGDGVADAQDRCPEEPEDKDGIEDGDGCPEDDVDGDGIADALDACPMDPGRAQSDPVRNGCPTPCLSISPQLRILAAIRFSSGSTTFRPDALAILDEIAQVMREHPDLTLGVNGHTDTTEADAVATKRAEGVKKELVKRKIDPARLDVRAFGRTRPISPNDTAEGRASNRRVDFDVTGQ